MIQPGLLQGDPDLWRDICLDNSSAIRETLDLLIKELQQIQETIHQGESQAIEEFLAKGQSIRQKDRSGFRTERLMMIKQNDNQAQILGPSRGLKGTFKVPGDKSISHRALILGSIAEGQTCIQGMLEGEDCLATP